MAEDIKLSGPVAIRADSRERVALDMMLHIGSVEDSSEYSNRDYWFKLYHECYRATQGYELERIKQNS